MRKKRRKKKKVVKQQEEDEDEEESSDDEEEYRKWKEQRKMKKLKKEKEKEKVKKKREKNIDKDNSEEKDEFPFPEDEKNNKKLPKNIDKNQNEDDEDEFPFPKNEKNNGEKKTENDEDKDNNVVEQKPQGPIISKKIYEQIKPDGLTIVVNLMKNSNAKYQEGVSLSNQGKYLEAINCFKHAKVSFMGVSKLIQTRTDLYSKDFRMIMTSKLNDKLKLVHQSAKEASTLLKEKRLGFMTNNPSKPREAITKQSTMGNNNINNNILNASTNANTNNYNYNFNALNMNNKNNNINNNLNTYNNNNNQNKQKSLHDKEEDAMDEKIESEIMSKNPGVKFSDIIGMNDMKQTLYEIIVVPQIRPDLFTGIRKPQRGILLFGPPGTGKTMIAKAIASECGSTFFNISASSLTSKWVGESEKTVKSLFKIAYKKVPSIIFIDEIDSILSKRSESENEATKRLKTEFLIQFDGLGSNTNARLLVIAATNRPMDLDEALLRRLPKRVYCGPLDEDGRFEFIKKVINRVETNLSDDDIREIAKRTNDYSNSDLMELCREAAYVPVRELSNEEILKLKKFRPLVKKDLLEAVDKIRGTLSKKVRDELQKWNEQFGGI